MANRKSNLRRKTFMTRDAHGCQFQCKAYYDHDQHTAMYYFNDTVKANSLAELKQIVSNL